MLWKLRLHSKMIHTWDIVNSFKSIVLYFGTVKPQECAAQPTLPHTAPEIGTLSFVANPQLYYTWEKQRPSGKQFRETALGN